MEPLGDEAQVGAHFGLFGDSANLDKRSVQCLHRTYHRLRNHFWKHTMELLADMGRVESSFGPFGDGVSVDVDRCTVCAKRTIGSEIVLGASGGTPR